MLPLFDSALEIIGQFGIKLHFLICFRVDKAKCLRVKCLSRYELETVLDELLVFGKYRSFQDLVSTVRGVVKQRMAYVLHVRAYLMRATGLKPAFHDRYITQILQYAIVRDGMSAVFPIRKGCGDTAIL